MSNVEAALIEQAKAHHPGSFRQSVLLSARRFKSGWAELGKLLVKVRDEGLFQEWGYESFEGYCLKELHIRGATAQKLLRSFSFLQKHEPRAVADGLGDNAPAFEVVEVLAGAEARGQLAPQEYRSVRDSIWNPDRPPNEVRRSLLERFPRPEPERPEASQLRRLAQLARRLASELAKVGKVPRAIAERAEGLAEDVEELTQRT